MRHPRRTLPFLFCLALLLPLAPAWAAPPDPAFEPIAPAQPTKVSPGQIEVVELFWYGCPHCYDFDPLLAEWVAKLPKDVKFRRVPAILGESWEPLGRAYFALEELGIVDKIHTALFDALHKGKRKIANEDDLAAFLAEQGVDKTKFMETFRSFKVDSQTRDAKAAGVGYGVRGVPTLIVNGKFRVNIGEGGFSGMLKTAAELIATERGGPPKGRGDPATASGGGTSATPEAPTAPVPVP
jgi:thiol:disulfide interchange protein DsbA